ncbi:hypothetical protein PV05_08504 [Exophiala xenobiotica]|uniref:2EXR domain-containing protein n=1 Tax=Exophiala xenobiotica TaxID=348802 RepID=A0A0D2CS80_9EURO|nr:uncharacterized protein PV05_08504 [Exophiala xenobiotica]KIW52892.1 hypothetical protein PV05_08504 [Exophiala xenobiotica]
MSLLALPPEIRVQIWSYIVRPTVIHPCTCADKALQCHQANHNHNHNHVEDEDENCCQSTALPYTYNYCDNQLLRVNRLIFNEAQPLFDKTEKERIYVLCNNLCLGNFAKSLTEGEWKSVRHLRVDLFVGWGNDCRDDWFLGQSHRWAKRYVAGALSKYEDQGRQIVVVPAEEVKEDFNGRRTLTVDIHFS